ncbi:MAG: isoleucine--tRNA ligase [Armatimonadota bacterium]|nr:isoleucine--tRNA ligase [Armatimonadota bacterium]
MDYSKTVNLPKTEFPMKANLPQREPDIQSFWEEIDLYRKSLEKPAPRGKFLLHDGPPYSNGDIHVGNAMQNKLPKDFITRYMSMRGYRAPFVPGWDNHGLPIENNVAAEFRKAHKQPTRIELRKRCREYAGSWVDKQRSQYRRLGIRGDWENPYLTMATDYEAAEILVFADLALNGYIYRGLRPIHWCVYDETALAEAEIEYESHSSHSIYVRFGLVSDPKGVFIGASDAYAMIWTTTPWTIPANVALAVHPEYEYALVKFNGATYLIAAELREAVLQAIDVTEFETIKTVKGTELEGLVFKHPLFDRESPIVFASYVTLEDGAGIVHTAPGHGREDFQTGQKFKLPIINPVNEKGVFTDEAGQFAGLRVLKEGNDAVVEALRATGALLASGFVTHSYPHCWRCHQPVIFRTTVQWFLNMEHNDLRKRILDVINSVNWLPADGLNRIRSLMESAPDWCLSRQRSWGVGIPVFYCQKCDKEVITRESFDAAHKAVAEGGSDAWFEKSAEEILPKGFKCPHCGGEEFAKENDVLDVWFDSGSSWRAVCAAREELGLPADLYYEGYDQYKAWFGKSLIVSMAITGKPPFKTVTAHGFVVDALGRAMHKSRGNVVKTTDVIAKCGADVVRLTACSFDVFSDAKLSDEALDRASDAYRRIRNTFRFLLGNLYDFDPERDSVPYVDMLEMDRWILSRLQTLVSQVNDGYDKYEFHRVFHGAHNFCTVELSSLYLDILKDRLYASAPQALERRSAQTAMYELLSALVRLLAPVLSHTAEEVWKYMPGANRPASVHLADFPEVNMSLVDAKLEAKWQELQEVRDEVYRVLEQARQEGVVGKPLESRVEINAPEARYNLLKQYEDQLPALLIVSQVALEKRDEGSELQVKVMQPQGDKCRRCWLVLETVGKSEEHPELCDRCVSVVSELHAG